MKWVLGIKHLIHFLDWHVDIYHVMRAADVVMLCSLTESESFGMVLAEAIVLSKPCIGANIEGIPEIIADKLTGLLFTLGFVDSPVSVMEPLASNARIRKAFGNAGCVRTRKLFNVAIQAESIVTVIGDATC